MKRSVCLATHNGAKYIEEQLHSILNELSVDDEVIIVDDHSSDNTVGLIKNIADSRIQIFENATNIGVNANFEKAISLSNGDVIFMADQDDIWTQGRVAVMTNALIQNKALLVSSNFDCFNNLRSRCIEHENKVEFKKSTKYTRNIFDIFNNTPTQW